jgi:hypothetical protein
LLEVAAKRHQRTLLTQVQFILVQAQLETGITQVTASNFSIVGTVCFVNILFIFSKLRNIKYWINDIL